MVMAQAARLNLRMQKELKLLLTDPPPGASFPTLTDQHHGSDGGGGGESSLTSIDALLQGPEETVYSNGVFKIKIQIPERYPFQPPIVTFATPIYHPNIDNGGRICLDILNLPPKGMWQPSLNISTVLTSIGLLLSEPNPDDGLMHEASRDYKYNRQAFDQNARSMTEKYAQAGVTDIARGGNGSQTVTSQSTSQTKVEAPVASICIPKHRKLSLESQGCSNNERDSGEEISKVPILNSTKNHIEIRLLKEATKDSSKYTGNSGKLDTGRYKLLPKVPVDSHSRNGKSGNTSMSNQCSPVLKIQTTSDSPIHSSVQAGSTTPIIDEGHEERSHSNNVGKGVQSLHSVRTTLCRDSDKKPHSIPQCNISHLDSVRPQKDSLWSHSISQNKAIPPKDATARKGYCSTSIRLKKRGLVGVMPLSERPAHPQNHDDKENLSPFRCLSPQLPEKSTVSSTKSAFIPESGIFCNGTKKMDEAPKVSEAAADDMVVLDSEDSDEENVPVRRSKLCLAKRCLSRKRKSGF